MPKMTMTRESSDLRAAEWLCVRTASGAALVVAEEEIRGVAAQFSAADAIRAHGMSVALPLSDEDEGGPAPALPRLPRGRAAAGGIVWKAAGRRVAATPLRGVDDAR